MINHHSSGVYQIRNLANGKIYVGSAATSFRRRWSQHKSRLLAGKHHSKKLQNAWNKYGPSCFAFEILLECPGDLCVHFEQISIDRLQTVVKGYNIAPTAGSRLGLKHSDATKAKMALRTASDATRAKLSAAGRARKPASVEDKAAMSLVQQTLPEAVKARKAAKCAKANTGRRASQETRDRMAKAQTGKKATLATREKLSKRRTGIPLSDAHKASVAAANRARAALKREIRNTTTNKD